VAAEVSIFGRQQSLERLFSRLLRQKAGLGSLRRALQNACRPQIVVRLP
jgi:hypothetical protein